MRKLGVLIISHGSRNDEWVKLVREAVGDVLIPEAIRDVADVALECVFLELVQGYLIQDGIDRLELSGVTDMIVVPLFVSSGSTHIDEISWALGTKAETVLPTMLQKFRIEANVHLCNPIDDDEEIAQLIVEKLLPLSVAPEQEVVLLVGHGSKEQDFHEQWQLGLRSLADQVQSIGGFAATDTVMLLPNQAADKIQAWHNCRPELSVLIAPLFLSEGYFTNVVIPERFAGFRFKYSGSTLLPSPYISRWIERRITNKVQLIISDGDE